ncbi:MAG: HAD family hydrolase [Anaerolineae bacterium]|nr:HAD family hydrolase [Anaerolineae bacterium]
MSHFYFGARRFAPALVIFDKDGTLIDFNFMWRVWATELAARLEAAAGVPVTALLYETIGYDSARQVIIPGSPLAGHSMADLRRLMTQVAREAGLGELAAERAVKQSWFVPDPVALARPLTDLPRLLGELRSRNIKTAVATSDDRGSTLATLRALGIASLVNAVVTADDGLPNKPAPDMLLHLCRELGIAPARAMMMGDSLMDMEAARAAKLGLRVGVLSGVTPREQFDGHADEIVGDIGVLMQFARFSEAREL